MIEHLANLGEIKENDCPTDVPLVAFVDGVIWDMNRTLSRDCMLKFCAHTTIESKMVLAHSSAHILGQVIKRTLKNMNE